MNLLAAIILKAKLYILLTPVAIGLTGAGMNQAVLVANGGKFPVMLNERAATGKWEPDKNGFIDAIHCVMTDKTHLNFLADYLNFQIVIMSPGDVLLELGEMLAAYAYTVWATVVVIELARQPKRLT